MGSDSPGQLMPYPYKLHSGRVINGNEPELSSGKEILRRGCNQLSSASPWRHKAKDHGTREEGKSFIIIIFHSIIYNTELIFRDVLIVL